MIGKAGRRRKKSMKRRWERHVRLKIREGEGNKARKHAKKVRKGKYAGEGAR